MALAACRKRAPGAEEAEGTQDSSNVLLGHDVDYDLQDFAPVHKTNQVKREPTSKRQETTPIKKNIDTGMGEPNIDPPPGMEQYQMNDSNDDVTSSTRMDAMFLSTPSRRQQTEALSEKPTGWHPCKGYRNPNPEEQPGSHEASNVAANPHKHWNLVGAEKF